MRFDTERHQTLIYRRRLLYFSARVPARDYPEFFLTIVRYVLYILYDCRINRLHKLKSVKGNEYPNDNF